MNTIPQKADAWNPLAPPVGPFVGGSDVMASDVTAGDVVTVVGGVVGGPVVKGGGVKRQDFPDA
jgi:hypothetical protein